MSASAPVLLAEVLARLAYLGRLRGAAVSLTCEGHGRLRASRLAVAVAADLDVQDSPWFRRDLAAALQAAGWRSVTNGNVRMWKGRLMR
jgi:hypothetical protein